MTLRVLLSAPYVIPIFDRFSYLFNEAGIEVEIAEVEERLSEEQLMKYAGQIDGTICGDDQYSSPVIGAFAPRLKVISKWGTGIDSIDLEAATEHGIKVCNTPGAFTEPVADTVMEYILIFARKGPWMDRQIKAGKWEKIPGVSLTECTLGVIGVGKIGRAVLRRAKSFGMILLGNDIVEIPEDFIAEVGIEMISLSDLLSKADFISLNCDLNPLSHHLINSEALTKMNPDAVMINTARGAVVDEMALIDALQNGRLAGAALDVYEDEPLPSDSPLLDFDNVLLGSHNANSSPKAWERVHWNTLRNLFLGLGIEISLPDGKEIQ
jgi:D-3-phosphoglycerate dehydrogenase